MYLFENVDMKQEYKNYISNLFQSSYIKINSALLTAQSRKRVYWTNIENIEQPSDKGIFLKDIIEDDVDEKYYVNNIKEINVVLNPKQLKKKYSAVNPDKALCMTARQFSSWNGTYQLSPVRIAEIGNGGQGERVYDIDGKSTALSALGGGRGAKTGLYCVASRGRNIVDGKRADIKGAKTEQRLEVRFDEKSNCLTTVQKDNYVLILIDGVYYRIRRLTPTEYEKLQGLKPDYTKGISDSKRYECLGNGWTVPVISHILSFIKFED